MTPSVLSPADHPTHSVHVSLNKAQADFVEKAAKIAGISRNAFVRRVVEEARRSLAGHVES